MEEIQKQAEKLRATKRPEDLSDNFILNEEPAPLKLHTSLNKKEQSLLTAEKLFSHPRKTRPKKPAMWNADISASTPGHFDEAGNFILTKDYKASFVWFVKRDGKIEGPFSEQEIKKEALSGALKGALIKRDFDRGFVEADSLMEDTPAFYYSKSLNKYFSAHQIVDRHSHSDASASDDDFYSQPATSFHGSRLDNFLRNNNISASAAFLAKVITGRRKEESVGLLGDITGLGRVENTILVELLVEHAPEQILTDVDKDGFMINEPVRQKGRRGAYQGAYHPRQH